MEFMTITEIASGLYRRNSTATEYAMAKAIFERLADDQKQHVRTIGRQLFLETRQVA